MSCDLSLPRGADGITYHTYYAYADDASGTGFTTTFDPNKEWEALLVTTTPKQTLVVDDFTGLWRNWKGATGAAGDATKTPIATKTASYSLNATTDGTIVVDVGSLSATCTLTLPDASTCNEKKFVIKPVNVPAATPYNVELTSVSNIEGSASDYIIGFNYQYGYIFIIVEVQSDGTEWWIIRRSVIDPREKYTAAVD